MRNSLPANVPQPSTQRDPRVRQVLVSVNASGQLVCLPSVVQVSGPGVLISFELQSAGWEFPGTGAVVVTAGGAQFPWPSWTLDKQHAALLDEDSEAGDFSYTVHVHKPETGQRLSLDPTIRNRP